MEDDLSALEDRLDEMLALLRNLRAENSELRARVAGLDGDKRRLTERVAAARMRLESLVERLPT